MTEESDYKEMESPLRVQALLANTQFCAGAPDFVRELLEALREAEEVEQRGYQRGIEAAAEIAERVRLVGVQATPESATVSIWQLVEKIGADIEIEIRALLPVAAAPPPPAEEGEGE